MKNVLGHNVFLRSEFCDNRKCIDLRKMAFRHRSDAVRSDGRDHFSTLKKIVSAGM